MSITVRTHTARRFGPLAAAALAALGALGVASTAEAGDKSGNFMVNLKLGGGFFTTTGGGSEFVLELDSGYAVIGKNGYLIFNPTFAFGSSTVVTLPVGFQYDIELVKDLYLYPRVTLGYSYLGVGGGSVHAFNLAPAIGVKYVLLNGRLNVGAEPFNMPLLFGSGGPYPMYRFDLYAGVNF